MNILPPITVGSRHWPVVLCAWCGHDLNANDNIGLWDTSDHFKECLFFLSSPEGRDWENRMGIKRNAH